MPTPPVKFPKAKPSSGKPPVRKGDGSAPGPAPAGNEQNWKGVLLLLTLGLAIMLFCYVSLHPGTAEEEISKAKLMDLIHQNRVQDINIESDSSSGMNVLTGKYKAPPLNAPTGADVEHSFKVPVNLEFDRYLQNEIHDAGFKGTIESKSVSNVIMPLIMNFLPIILFVGVMYFLFRQQIRMAGKSAFSFGKSKARMMTRDRNKVTFKDVAGIDEAKEELSEIVEFLRDPRRFQKLGGRIPKGVLMIGPPGTGKTLLAKAIAGEADVPFFSISGSDFVEMFVGVGASRVRDMFEQGKKNAPCLIFIDEIDAVGRSRGTGMGGGHDEREQTLNALLVEMDGIETAGRRDHHRRDQSQGRARSRPAAPRPFRPRSARESSRRPRPRADPAGPRAQREAGQVGRSRPYRARHARLLRRGAGQRGQRSRAAGRQA